MKRIIAPILLLAAIVLAAASCTSATAYSTQLKNEKKLIDDYIKRNNIKIIYEEPAYDQWQPNEYYELDDYCYFHLTKMGDTATAPIKDGNNVTLRYRRYTLNVNADTLSYWTSNDASYPVEFAYNITSAAACTAWHYALKCMKYSGAEGKLICPSKLGFSEDANSVTPYGYDMKFRIKNF